jgi:photosystem II stability/assembly factor-like uncharacterized protein
MKTIKLLLTALIFTAFSVDNLSAQWTSTGYYPLGGFGGESITNKIYFINSQTGFVIGEFTYWHMATQCQNTGFEFNRTTDGGASWTIISQMAVCPGGPLFAENDICFINSMTGYVAGNLTKTTNGGVNWSFLSSQNFITPTGISFVSEQTGYATSSSYAMGRIHKTTNGGTNWITQHETGYFLSKIRFIDENKGIACGVDGKILSTTNGGTNWTEISTGSNDSLKDIAFLNSTTAVIAGFNGSEGKIYRSTDGGASWNVSVTSATKLNTLSFPNSMTGYVGGENYYRTTDAGATWESHTSNFPGSSRALSMYFVSPDTGYASSWNTIYKTYTAGITSIQPYSSEIPEGFRLHQNFPNPFNPSTVIRFDIPASSKSLTELRIYDINGKEVQLVLSGSPVPGSYEYKWDASGMPTGLYFYKLTVQGENSFSEVKKMMLVK